MSLGVPPPSARGGRLAATLLTSLFVLVVLAAGMTFVGLPYVILSPGPATNVLGEVDGKPVLSVQGAQTYPTQGALDFHDRRLRGRPRADGDDLRPRGGVVAR